LSAVHLVAHGAPGLVSLGSGMLSAASLPSYAGELATLKASLAPGADLSSWSCDVAAGPGGQALLDGLSAASGATVAASTHAVGAAALGGSWQLDAQTGPVSVTAPFATEHFTGTLGIISTFAGNGSQVFSGDGGAATGAGIYQPYNMAVDAAGNIYIV